MTLRVIIAGLIGAVALVGTVTPVAAQTGVRSRAPALSLSEAGSAQRNASAGIQTAAQRRGLRWNENGRWGLNFNANQPVGRETEWGDVEAGAYYRVNPRLSVGAAAGLASPQQDPARAAETDRRSQPRIRLESIFKF